MDSFFFIATGMLCLLTASGDRGIGKARSCSDIRHFYSGKGFHLDDVPQSEISAVRASSVSKDLFLEITSRTFDRMS
ncbi:unnamed protein product [Arctogadus glacialis]